MSTVSDFDALLTALGPAASSSIELTADISITNSITIPPSRVVSFLGKKFLRSAAPRGITAVADATGGKCALSIDGTPGFGSGAGKFITIRNASIPEYNGVYEVYSTGTSPNVVTVNNMPYRGTATGEVAVEITCDSMVDAPRVQIFDTSFAAGEIHGLFRGDPILPEWWGINWSVNSGHDAAINKAIRAASPGGPGSTISLAAGRYWVSAPLDMRDANCRLAGAGSHATSMWAATDWAPPVWEDSSVFTWFTSTELNIGVREDSHAAMVWLGTGTPGGGKVFRTGVSGISFTAFNPAANNPDKYVSVISSTGWLEKETMIEDIGCSNYSGFAVGFHHPSERCVVRDLTLRNFWMTENRKREGLAVFIPPDAENCTVQAGTVAAGIYESEAPGGVSAPRDWATVAIVAGGDNTLVDSIHIEGTIVGVYVLEGDKPGTVTVTNVDGNFMMDHGLLGTNSPGRAVGEAPSLADQATAANTPKNISHVACPWQLTISAISKNDANLPVEITVTGHGLPNTLTTYDVTIANAAGTTPDLDGTQRVQYVDSNTLRLVNVLGSLSGTYTPNSGKLTGPIIVTCTDHGLSTGSPGVAIQYVGGVTDANGFWTVTALTRDTFFLNGSAAPNQTYTSGGTVARYLVATYVTGDPLTLQMSHRHGLTTGAKVTIYDVDGQPNANGFRTVTSVDGNNFTIDAAATTSLTPYHGKVRLGHQYNDQSHYRRYASMVVIGKAPHEKFSAENWTSKVILKNIANQANCRYLLRDAFYGVETKAFGRNQYPNRSTGFLASYERTNEIEPMPGSYPYPTVTVGGTSTSTGALMVLTATRHGFVNGDLVYINGVHGTANGLRTVANVTPHTFTIGVNGTGSNHTGGTASLYTTITSVVNNSNTSLTFTTATPHYTVGGDKIIVRDVRGISGANGILTIATVPNATSFTVDGTFNGTYAGGGLIGPDPADYRAPTFLPQNSASKTYFTGPVI